MYKYTKVRSKIWQTGRKLNVHELSIFNGILIDDESTLDTIL